MTPEETKLAQQNTLRVATNLSVMLNSKEVLIPAKYAQAILEGQKLLEGFIVEVKKQLEDTTINPEVVTK